MSPTRQATNPRTAASHGRPRRAPRRRAVHPWAWWIWALGIAASVAFATNPVLLALAVAVLAFVVAARRGNSLWARAFPLYLVMALFIIGFRVVMHVLVGVKFGKLLVVGLPTFDLPTWTAGITLLGPIYLEGLLDAALNGARLGLIIIAFGAANSLANPKRMVRHLPGALGELGTALVIAMSVAPQLAMSVFRVRRARALRGDRIRGLRAIGRLLLPVLQDTLDRSLQLASSMDARGYGRRAAQPVAVRRLTAALTLSGLIGICVGVFVLLAGTAPLGYGLGACLAGLILGAAALTVSGRRRTATVYRPDRWEAPEWFTAATGVVAAAAGIYTQWVAPRSIGMPLQPLSVPEVPILLVGALLLAVLPAFVTPEPPGPARRRPARGAATIRKARRG